MEAIRTVPTPRLALAPRWIAGGALGASIVASYLLAAGMASSSTFFVTWSERPGFGFPGWLAGPLKGTGLELTIPRFMLLVLALYGLYLLVVRYADAVPWSWAIAAIGVLHLVWLLAPPMWLTDAFNYLGYLRIGARHDLNPYTHFLEAVPGDAAFRWVTWPKLHSPYGPLFLAGFWPVAFVGVPAGLWTFKLTVAAAAVGCIALVGRLARELDRPVVPAMLFVGLNPLWLAYGVGGAHNDMFMLVLLLGGLLAFMRRHETAAGAMVILGAAIKASGGLLLPFMLVGARDRRKLLIGAAAAGAFVVVISVIFFSSDPLAALTSFANQGGQYSLKSFPGQAAQVLLGVDMIGGVAEAVANALLLIVVAALIVRAWRGANWLDSAGWATVALLLSLVWLMPWYIVWLLPLAAITRDRRLRVAALVFGAFLVLLYIP
jgi:alpha-1,6-mannosyltransferase